MISSAANPDQAHRTCDSYYSCTRIETEEKFWDMQFHRLAPFASLSLLIDFESAAHDHVASAPPVIHSLYLLMHPDLCSTPRLRTFFDFCVSEFRLYRPVLRGEASGQRSSG